MPLSLQEQFALIIAQSSLIANEQKDFLDALSGADNMILAPIIDLCIQDASQVRVLYENYKIKETAHKEKDASKWSYVLQDEERLLENIKTPHA